MFDRINNLCNIAILAAFTTVGGFILAGFTLPALFAAFVLFVVAAGWLLG